MSPRAPRPLPTVSPFPATSPVASAAPAASPVPAVPLASPPCGRQLIDTFSNNLINVLPADYMWSKDNSIYTLCHKATPDVEPKRALFWVVGEIDTAALTKLDSFSAWTASIRLNIPTNTALCALLDSGPYQSYTSPARYSILRLKATLPHVLEQLSRVPTGVAIPGLGDFSTEFEGYPFSYDGSTLVRGGPTPEAGFDLYRFTDQTTVVVEVAFTGYQIGKNVPGFSVPMQGIYYLETTTTNTPSTPGKRKGGCILSPTRQRGAPFAPDPSKTT